MFDWVKGHERATPILDKISAAVGLDLSDLGTAEASGQLAQNHVAQILVVGYSLAVRAVLTDLPDSGLIVAGYSVGDLSAHSVSGALSVDDALALAEARGRAMDRAAQSSGASLGMTGIRGLSIAAIEDIINGTAVEIALVNGRDHVVVGGTTRDLATIEDKALSAGAHVKRIGVTVASHTSYLNAAAVEFEETLKGCQWRRPAHRLLSPIDGAAVTTKEAAVERLARQIRARLDWASTMQSLVEYGVTATIELGAGRALSAMIAEEVPQINARAVEDFKTVDGLSRWVSRYTDA
jgi:[acyl-carrier-protein] S-malonyltransferase